MKFEYEVEKAKDEPVALIANGGTLYIKTEKGCVAFYACGGSIELWEWDIWSEYLDDHEKAFYPGDKITITF